MPKCLCSSGKAYEECCEPFHKGAIPETALQLMRSRFSAYALNKQKYIEETTHPDNPSYIEVKKGGFYKDYVFQKLEILDFHEQDCVATVTFTAFLAYKGKDASFTEKSIFEKVNGRWLYKSGSITN